MSSALIVSPEAQAQVRIIDAWWRENRPASPNLFVEELAQAFATIEFAPDAGQRYRHPDVPGVRRVVMRSTRNHIYYVSGSSGSVVLAVWGAIKGSGPVLSSP